MKSVLNIVAAVLVAAGLVVAVASLLTPGQVILGIDFKLAATLVVGGLILHALARALLLLERIGKELRLLRKAGLEEPPWLRESAGEPAVQSAAQSVAAMAPAVAAASSTAEHKNGGADFAGETVLEEAPEHTPIEAEPEWLKPVEGQHLGSTAEEWVPHGSIPAAEEEPEPPFIEPPAPEPTLEPEDQATPSAEPVEERAADEVGASIEPEPSEAPGEPEPEVAGAPEPAEARDDGPESPSEPEPEEAAVEPPLEPEPEEAAVEPPGEPEPVDAVAEHPAGMPTKLRPSRDSAAAADESTQIAAEFTEAEDYEQDAAGEHPALYVVEERMFRGQQVRVLSDGTIEAETVEGWMRFEDFDHLEEYLEAMAEMDRQGLG